MSKVSEKISYLEGLLDGLDLQDAKTAKVLRGILDALREMADELEDQEDAIADLEESTDDLWEVMKELEEDLFDSDWDEEEEDDWDEDDDEDEGFDVDEFLELTCQHCGNTIYFDEDMLDTEDGLICPSCNKPITIEIRCGDCEE